MGAQPAPSRITERGALLTRDHLRTRELLSEKRSLSLPIQTGGTYAMKNRNSHTSRLSLDFPTRPYLAPAKLA